MTAAAPVTRGGSVSPDAALPDGLADTLGHLARGRPIVLAADRDRGIPSSALVFAAQFAAAEVVAFTVRHTSGYICVAVPEHVAQRLALPTMPTATDFVPEGSVPLVTVDARHGINTGISAHDRARTIAVLASPMSTAADLTRPGHVVPVRTPEIMRSRGLDPAIAARTLATLAGLVPVAAWADLVNSADPSQMADAAGGAALAKQYGLSVVHPRDLIARIAESTPIVVWQGHQVVDLELGRATVIRFRELQEGPGHGAEHLLFAFSPEPRQVRPGLVQVHRECVAGDVLGSGGCGCRDHLRCALRSAARDGGLVCYLRAASSVSGEGAGCAVRVQPPAGAPTDPRSVLLVSSMLAQMETVSRVGR